MGSPNFLSDLPHANFAIEVEHYEDESEQEFACDDVREIRAQVEEAVKNLIREVNPMFFDIKVENGYHSGFQVYVDEDISAADVMKNDAPWWAKGDPVERYLGDGRYGECSDEKFLKAAKHGKLTVTKVQKYMDKEVKALNAGIEAIAREHGLGRIVGRSYCSSVDHNWDSAKNAA